MDNNQSPIDSEQPISTEDSQPQPSTTDEMASNVNNYIHPGATQYFYHKCCVTNAAPAAAFPTGSPNEPSSQPAEEGNADVEYDYYQCVYLPQAMFTGFSEKKATTVMEVVMIRRKINRARLSLKWQKTSFSILSYWTENDTSRAVQWIKAQNLFINLLVCYYQL
jgi:hypothetical protein